MNVHRVHEIAYLFDGPSEKNVSPQRFSIAKHNLVSVLNKICPHFASNV